MIFVSSLAVLLSLTVLSVSCQKSVGVRGLLKCGGNTMPNAIITLTAERPYQKSDTELAAMTSDARGYFEVCGVARGIRKLNAVVKVKHSCGFTGNLNNFTTCERTVAYRVPDEYVAKKTTNITNWYQLDTPDMSIVQINEMGRC